MTITVRLTPRGGADRIDGLRPVEGGTALAARVRAAPEKGLANQALEELIAGLLGVSKTDVTVAAGRTSRLKTVQVARPPGVLKDRLDAITREEEGDEA
ncbi:DUF167 family protein [Lutibaculum baratangense]|uniref:UPF0235 protein N177_1259 n=1 Tax=Lutibaculum baratangense AMV1 TaxID=631454 RepID=V4RKV6_9HYPH|nr:DUF167 family protein [Lutibaculum baratangense]ESR25924.1 hypothetical protein N177_1259 [Lutibaculum baratangense AMV1]